MNPVPDVLPVTDQTVCANSPVLVDLGSSTSVVNTVYNWTNSNTVIGAASAGAGDISFVASFMDSLDGLGASGSGAHAPGETINMKQFPALIKRNTILLYRLTR